jgi:hypothetical protein
MSQTQSDYMAEAITGIVITLIMVYGVAIQSQTMYLPAMLALVGILFGRMFFRGL